MFLVCDRTHSERAAGLRKRILDAGYPCACCTFSELPDNMPVLRILTFTDVFDEVRRTPFDDVRVLAVGDGFVNSALNADQVPDESEVLRALYNVFREFFHVRDECVFQYGVMCDDGVFLAEPFFTVFGNLIVPTEREYLIFKYLHVAFRLCDYVPAARICRFCYPTAKIPADEQEAAKNLAVHINHLNRKAEAVMHTYLIEARRFAGYRMKKL